MAQAHETAIDILSDGFFDNPVLAWIFPDEATRTQAITDWFHFWISFYGDQGHVHVTGDEDGAAVWASPDAPPLSGENALPLVELVRRYSGDRVELVFQTFAQVKLPEPRHWYLNGIAARRDRRSRGAGARLLEPYLARSDQQGVPVYLESSNPRNLTFYYRHGFEDMGPAIDLPGAGPVLRQMWREPGADAGRRPMLRGRA